MKAVSPSIKLLVGSMVLATQTHAVEFASEWPATQPNPNPVRIEDKNPDNRLQHTRTFSGKHYGVYVTGSNLDEDINGDLNPNRLQMKGPQVIDLPQGASIEAAYLYYSGSIYYDDPSDNSIKDDTPDTDFGGTASLDTVQDAADNQVDIKIDGISYTNLTPASVGGDSTAAVSWWNIHAKEGTLMDSLFGYYTNRIDLTGMIGTAPNTIEVTRLERADFAGNQANNGNDGVWFHPPAAPNGNGEYANDCHSGSSYNLVIVYSLPAGPNKTVSIYDGATWVWDNDFATNRSKTYDPIRNPLAVDLVIDHEAIDASQPVKVTIGAIDGDVVWRPTSTMPECGSQTIHHGTGQEYTWVKVGNGSESLYHNLYESISAPARGLTYTDRPYDNYMNVKSLGKGINYNLVEIDVLGAESNATQTVLHWQADSANSTDFHQEGFALTLAIFEATTTSGEPTNTAPVISLLGDNPMTVNLDLSFADPGATAMDSEDGDISTAIVTSGSVDTSSVGSYQLTYDVTDSGGLSAETIIRTVNVIDPNACVDYSAPVSDHESAGRAYKVTTGKGKNRVTTYYATGSDENLGTDSSAIVTLIESSAGYFETGSC
ncbi:MAG: DUF5011 domain-containing protein [Cellvibrionaceae bacterium]